MDQRRDIAIVGPGKVGTALAVLAQRASMRIVAICGRTEASAKSAAEHLTASCRFDVDALAQADLVLLTVRDDQIASTCGQLVADGKLAPSSIVAHCSGSLGSDILAPAREIGCKTASIHPLQTFPNAADAIERLAGSYVFCEGDNTALLVLEPMLRQMGTIAVRIDPAGKALYHAAAVMACNYLTGLFDAALDLAAQAGIHRDTACKALAPLVRATVENTIVQGPARALTGPIARGDVGTVGRHLDAIDPADADMNALYRAAGLWTLRVARAKALAETTDLDDIESALRNPNNCP